MSPPAILLTGVGKRYDIVSAFAQHATVIAADPNPLAPPSTPRTTGSRRRASTTPATCRRSRRRARRTGSAR